MVSYQQTYSFCEFYVVMLQIMIFFVNRNKVENILKLLYTITGIMFTYKICLISTKTSLFWLRSITNKCPPSKMNYQILQEVILQENSTC